MRCSFVSWTIVTALAALLLSVPAWAAGGDGGRVKVINDTDFTLEIRMDGKARFTLGPGDTQTIGDVAPGLHEFKAVTSGGDVKFTKSMKVSAGQTLSWYLKWTRAEGLLVIDNPNGVPVSVLIDGRPTLGVGPLDFRAYGNIGTGTHDLRVTCSRVDGEVELLSSRVAIDGLTTVELTLPRSSAGEDSPPDDVPPPYGD